MLKFMAGQANLGQAGRLSDELRRAVTEPPQARLESRQLESIRARQALRGYAEPRGVRPPAGPALATGGPDFFTGKIATSAH